MTKFKRIDTSNGRTLYYVDGRMKSIRDIPEAVLSQLQANTELEIDLAPETPVTFDTRKCIFDNLPSTHKKFVNLITVGLCDEDFQTKNTGKVAQKIRELQLT